MTVSNKTIALAVGGALLLSMGTASFAAAENPFAIKSLSSGYQVADADMKKMKDGKCGTGKCGANKKAAAEKMEKEGSSSADKMKEGSCHGDMKAKEGSCSAEKAAEGKCSAEMKGKEGSCHADKK